MTRAVRINRGRLWACLMELKQIGAYDDEATGLRGVRRLALTDADAEARRRCVDWMLQAGLAVRVDSIGNVYATRPGRDRSLPCVLMGSHIDTVATGGAFDGTLGVLGGIEVMRTLNGAGIQTLRDIEVGLFTEEDPRELADRFPGDFTVPANCADPAAILAIAAPNLATIIEAYDDFLDLALGKDHVSHHLVTKLLGQETHRLADLEAAQAGGRQV